MISIATSAVLASACFASASAFFFDPSSGVFTGTALSLNGGNALALSSGTAATAYLTSAGIGVAALGILGLAVVKMALLAGEEARQKRSTVEDLAEIDNYFENIAAMDVDDCGKLFVCQLEAVPAEVSPDFILRML